MHHRIPVLRVPAIALGACLVAACTADDSPKKLFDEDGYWSVSSYQLAGGPQRDIDENVRRDGFLMWFQAEEGVVQTALCGSNATETPDNSQCLYNPQQTWFCDCFRYAAGETAMIWRDPAGNDTAMDDSSTGDAPPGAEPTTVFLAKDEDVESQYTLTPLPAGIFGSDGDAASFTIRQKTATVWSDVAEVCEPCI